MKKLITGAFAMLAIFNCRSQNSNALKNDDIIKMYQSGLSQEVILKKIAKSGTSFDLSSDALIKLKSNKIPDTILLTMMDGDHPSQAQINSSSNTKEYTANVRPIEPTIPITNILKDGVYYFDRENDKYFPIRNNKTIKAMISNKTMMTGGLSRNMEYQFNNVASLNKISDSNPVFYVKVEDTFSELQPSDLILFEGVHRKGKRLRIVRWTGEGEFNSNRLPGNAKFPIVEKQEDHLYKISFKKKLRAGNYFLGPRDSPMKFCFDFDVIDKIK